MFDVIIEHIFIIMMSENFNRPIVITIGISGVTCGGKTTTATKLLEILPNSRIVTQDDYYLDEHDSRHVWIPELNHVNYDILSSLDMNKMYEDVAKIIDEKIPIKRYDISKIKFQMNDKQEIGNKLQESFVSFLIVEGFSVFNYKPLLHLFDLKYYFILDEAECSRRRKTRVYNPPDCPGYFEKCAWPEHLKQQLEVRSCIKDVTYFDGNSNDDFIGKILDDIVNIFRPTIV